MEKKMQEKKIEEIDSNFKTLDINGINLEFRDASSAPFTISGFPWYQTEQQYCRLPQEILPATNPGVETLAWHTTGGTIRFKTDSPTIALDVMLQHSSNLTHMAHSGVAGFDLYLGRGKTKQFFGNLKPDHGQNSYKGLLINNLNAGLIDCTIYFPLYSGVKSLHIGLQPGCRLEEPTPYSYEKPVVFYGSSITQGACASHPGNAYTHIISRRLDANLVNLGFSGSCKAEPIIAENIAELEMSCFVYDYDYNAPNFEHLKNTHEPFFKIIRDKQPDLPVVMVSKPDFYGSQAEKDRREVIKTTYNNAIAAGDKNAYFIDGELLFGKTERDLCTVDRCHPNDIGFLRMADIIYPVVKQVLSS